MAAQQDHGSDKETAFLFLHKVQAMLGSQPQLNLHELLPVLVTDLRQHATELDSKGSVVVAHSTVQWTWLDALNRLVECAGRGLSPNFWYDPDAQEGSQQVFAFLNAYMTHLREVYAPESVKAHLPKPLHTGAEEKRKSSVADERVRRSIEELAQGMDYVKGNRPCRHRSTSACDSCMHATLIKALLSAILELSELPLSVVQCLLGPVLELVCSKLPDQLFSLAAIRDIEVLSKDEARDCVEWLCAVLACVFPGYEGNGQEVASPFDPSPHWSLGDRGNALVVSEQWIQRLQEVQGSKDPQRSPQELALLWACGTYPHAEPLSVPGQALLGRNTRPPYLTPRHLQRAYKQLHEWQKTYDAARASMSNLLGMQQQVQETYNRHCFDPHTLEAHIQYNQHHDEVVDPGEQVLPSEVLLVALERLAVLAVSEQVLERVSLLKLQAVSGFNTFQLSASAPLTACKQRLAKTVSERQAIGTRFSAALSKLDESQEAVMRDTADRNNRMAHKHRRHIQYDILAISFRSALRGAQQQSVADGNSCSAVASTSLASAQDMQGGSQGHLQPGEDAGLDYAIDGEDAERERRMLRLSHKSVEDLRLDILNRLSFGANIFPTDQLVKSCVAELAKGLKYAQAILEKLKAAIQGLEVAIAATNYVAVDAKLERGLVSPLLRQRIEAMVAQLADSRAQAAQEELLRMAEEEQQRQNKAKQSKGKKGKGKGAMGGDAGGSSSSAVEASSSQADMAAVENNKGVNHVRVIAAPSPSVRTDSAADSKPSDPGPSTSAAAHVSMAGPQPTTSGSTDERGTAAAAAPLTQRAEGRRSTEAGPSGRNTLSVPAATPATQVPVPRSLAVRPAAVSALQVLTTRRVPVATTAAHGPATAPSPSPLPQPATWSGAASHPLPVSAPPRPQASAPAPSSSSDDHLCVVCMERRCSEVLVPCGHVVLCEECCAAVEAANNECPMCRAPIDAVLHVM